MKIVQDISLYYNNIILFIIINTLITYIYYSLSCLPDSLQS